MKVFLDTNVLVSAIATHGLCTDLFREVLSTGDLVVSQALLDEFESVLSHKFHLSSNTISEVLTLLRADSEMAKPGYAPAIKIKDKDDLIILEASVCSGSEVFVTGDKELQKLEKIGDMEIISPRKFWEMLRCK